MGVRVLSGGHLLADGAGTQEDALFLQTLSADSAVCAVPEPDRFFCTVVFQRGAVSAQVPPHHARWRGPDRAGQDGGEQQAHRSFYCVPGELFLRGVLFYPGVFCVRRGHQPAGEQLLRCLVVGVHDGDYGGLEHCPSDRSGQGRNGCAGYCGHDGVSYLYRLHHLTGAAHEPEPYRTGRAGTVKPCGTLYFLISVITES